MDLELEYKQGDEAVSKPESHTADNDVLLGYTQMRSDRVFHPTLLTFAPAHTLPLDHPNHPQNTPPIVALSAEGKETSAAERLTAAEENDLLQGLVLTLNSRPVSVLAANLPLLPGITTPKLHFLPCSLGMYVNVICMYVYDYR